MSTTTETEPSALDAHVGEYLTANVDLIIGTGIGAGDLRRAVEHGWHGARADLAETLRDLIDEARAEVAKRKPFPILNRLDAIVTELENGLGQ